MPTFGLRLRSTILTKLYQEQDAHAYTKPFRLFVNDVRSPKGHAITDSPLEVDVSKVSLPAYETYNNALKYGLCVPGCSEQLCESAVRIESG